MEIQFSTKLSSAMQEFLSIQDYLKEEMKVFSKLADNPESLTEDRELGLMMALRMQTRSYLAFAESYSFMLRQMVISLSSEEKDHYLAAEEKIVLEGNKITVTDNGKVVLKSDFMSTLKDIEFSVRLFAKVFTDGFQLNKDNGWESFKSLVKIRNRITHPAGFNSLLIVGDDLLILRDAESWFARESTRLIRAGAEKYAFMR